MSVVKLTKAEVYHLKTALESWDWWMSEYPETVNQQHEDELAVALEIINGVKLYETE